MGELLIPVGHDVGAIYTEVGAELPDSYEVVFADGAFELSRDEYVIWRLSAGNLDVIAADGAPSREQVLDEARDTGVTEPDKVFAELVRAGTIVTLDPASETAAQVFAFHHRALPLQRGYGNGPDEPAVFEVAADNNTSVLVGAFTYHIWARGHRQPNIWQGCQTLFDQRAEGETLDWDATAVLAEFFLFLPQLLAGNCVYIDRSN